MALICIEQNLRIIWSSIHEKGNTETELKKALLVKKCVSHQWIET